MGLPSDLVSRSVKRLTKPKPPTLQELLGSDRPPPMTDAQRAGLKATVVLATRSAADFERAEQSRLEARANVEAQRDREILAAYDRRIKESI
jgi:hypothetical protein